MGRSPCCDADGLKRGPWTTEEDQKLLAYIQQHGHGSWRFLPKKAGLQRCGKSCRLRWTNYLRPDIKRGKFNLQEERTIIQLHALLGNRWSAIAAYLPRRTDNEIKNYWNTHLKKRLALMGIDPVTHKPKRTTLDSANGDPKNVSNLSHIAQWESARLEAEARLVRESKLRQNEPSNNMLVSFDQVLEKMPSSFSEPRCLDILKAWESLLAKEGNGNMSHEETPSLGFGVGSNPTSSSTLLENNVLAMPTNTLGTCGGGDLDEIFAGSRHDQGVERWTVEGVSDHNVDGNNLIEGFTNMLNSNLDYNHNPIFNGDDFYEGNKNYWNEVLNLVNFGPSNLPVF